MHSLLRNRAAFAALATTVLAVGACRDDRASVTEPFGPTSFDARLIAAPLGVPNGDVTMADAGETSVGGSTFGSTTRVFRFASLDSLVGTNVYQVFLGVEGGTLRPAVGELTVVRTDTTFDAAGDPQANETITTQNGVSSFQNGGSNVTVYLSVSSSEFGEDDFDSADLALVTIEANAGATTPTLSGPRPLWARLNDTDTFSFGTYDPDPTKEMVFVPVGRGIARFRGSVLTVDDSALMRPPVGYYYETHVVARNAGAVDEAGSLNLGPQTAPFPRRAVSLIDADVSIPDPVVIERPAQIRAASARLVTDSLAGRGSQNADCRFAGLAEIYVTLEAKAGRSAVRSPTIVLQGTTPAQVSAPAACSTPTR